VFEPIIYTYYESLSVFLATFFFAAGFFAAVFFTTTFLVTGFFASTLGVAAFLFFKSAACFAFYLRRDFFCFLFANFCFLFILIYLL
jgi:hypothetical protein